MKKIKHRIEAFFIGALILFAKKFSRDSFLSLGEKLGLFAYFLGIRKKVVRKNLETAFSEEMPLEEIRKIERLNYRFTGKFLFDTICFYFIDLKEAEKIIRLDFSRTPELESRSHTRDKPIIFLTYHYSNIYSTVLLGMFFGNMYNYARIQKNPLVDRFLVEIRNRFKMEAISGSSSRQNSFRRLFEVLKNNAILGYACDQSDWNSDLFVPFFGEPASISKGVGRLPFHSKADVYLFHPRFCEDNVYEFRFEKLEYDAEGEKDRVIRQIAESYNRYLEEIIRREPAQYFWMHKRWKNRPPEKGTEDFYR